MPPLELEDEIFCSRSNLQSSDFGENSIAEIIQQSLPQIEVRKSQGDDNALQRPKVPE